MLLKYFHIIAAMIFVTGYLGGAMLQVAGGRATDWSVRRVLIGKARTFSNGLLVPGFVVAGVLGVLTALAFGYPLHRGWVAYALALYVVILVTGLAYWNPLERKLTASAKSEDEATFQALSRRTATRFIGILDGLVVLALIYLMVVRPS